MKKVKEPKVKKVKEKREGKRGGALPVACLIALIVAALGYVAMLRMEVNVLTDYEKTKILVAKVNVPEDTLITEDNLNTYFIQKEIDNNILPKDYISEASNMYGLAAAYEITENTPVSSNMFYSVNEIYAAFDQPQMLGLNTSDISWMVTGRVRTGDRVNIYVIEKVSNSLNSEEVAELKIANKKPVYENVYVAAVYDASGKEIPNDDVVSVAQRINIVLEKEDASKVLSKAINGSVIVTKSVDVKDN